MKWHEINSSRKCLNDISERIDKEKKAMTHTHTVWVGGCVIGWL